MVWGSPVRSGNFRRDKWVREIWVFTEGPHPVHDLSGFSPVQLISCWIRSGFHGTLQAMARQGHASGGRRGRVIIVGFFIHTYDKWLSQWCGRFGRLTMGLPHGNHSQMAWATWDLLFGNLPFEMISSWKPHWNHSQFLSPNAHGSHQCKHTKGHHESQWEIKISMKVHS